MLDHPHLKKTDPEIEAIISAEEERQEYGLELIASENYVSRAVLEAVGSVATNKYAEGYPGKRYYGGCHVLDKAEELAQERAKQLFGVDFANVQPHSGSSANAEVYMALLKPGDRLLGMDLSQGGHLTHGAKMTSSGKYYDSHFYGVDDQGLVDYDAVEKKAEEVKPQMLVTGFSAYTRVLDWARLRKIADKVGALMMADIAHVAGLVAAGVYPSPVGHAHVITTTTHKTLRGPRGGMIMAHQEPEIAKKINSSVFPGMQGGPLMHVIAGKAVAFKEALTPEFKEYQKQIVANSQAMARKIMERGYNLTSGGTDNHILLFDLRAQGITGKEAEEALELAHLTVNKNAVPNDPNPPNIASGIRIGTPTITTRGLKEKESEEVGSWISDILDDRSEENCAKIKEKVIALCKDFPYLVN